MSGTRFFDVHLSVAASRPDKDYLPAKRKKYAKKPPQPKSDQELTDAWIKLMIGDRKVEGGELVLDIIDNIVMLSSSMSLILLQKNIINYSVMELFDLPQGDTINYILFMC